MHIGATDTHQLKEGLCPEKVQVGEAKLLRDYKQGFPGLPSPPQVHRQVLLLRRPGNARDDWLV